MSGGWIKLEKDLLTDPRLQRMARALCNGDALQGVTVVLGGLAHLWMIADTHISNEDVLPLGANEINQIIGVQGFCQLLPPNWLQVIDADNVKLPGFHTHNGTIAKERALNQRRVANYRDKRNGGPLQAGNGHPLPDQDQDLKEKKKSIQKKKIEEVRARKMAKRVAHRLPDDWRLDMAGAEYAKNLKLDPSATAEAFRDHWLASNLPTATKRDWSAAWRTWCRRAAQERAITPPGRRDDSAAWAEAKAHGEAIGFRAPWPQESVGAYTTAVKMHETRGPTPAAVMSVIRARQ